MEADQADLSAEWYFADKSVLSGALFWKDIERFITLSSKRTSTSV